jgi:hypothetical protein
VQNTATFSTSSGANPELKFAPESFYDPQKKRTVFAYDPSGLRTPRAITTEAANKELEKILPDHLPTPWWTPYKNEIIADCERKNIPLVPGWRYPSKIPETAFQAKW